MKSTGTASPSVNHRGPFLKGERVAAFVAACSSPLTLTHAPATALQQTAPVLIDRSYLRHTPPPRRLEHRVDDTRHRSMPAAVEVPRLACCAAARVTSLEELFFEVCKVCARLPLRHSFHEASLAISGSRNQKLSLIPPHILFAVWHRLPIRLPASPSGPFMVELFAAGLFLRSPRWSLPDVPAAEHVLPTPARVERARSEERRP